MTTLSPLWLSLQVATVGTLLMLPAGIAVAWLLSHGRSFRGKVFLETLLTLPLVLPPTVVGFYLLFLLGHGSSFGEWLNDVAGIRLLFTWEGAAVAAAIMAFPMFMRTATAAFASVDTAFLEAARIHGATEWAVLTRVTIPLSYRGLLAAFAMAFARALGEFGATLMVAGSIPGQTQTLPLALYAAVQSGHTREAWNDTLLLSIIALVLLSSVGAYQNQVASRRGER